MQAVKSYPIEEHCETHHVRVIPCVGRCRCGSSGGHVLLCNKCHAASGSRNVYHCAGDLCDMTSDAPEVQQLSVWLEYNRVVRRRLVWEAATALGCCRPGGCVILRVPDLLTTFTVGVLCVLHRCFRFFTLVKPFTSCTAAAESFALFMDCLQQPEMEEGNLTPCVHLLKVRLSPSLQIG